MKDMLHPKIVNPPSKEFKEKIMNENNTNNDSSRWKYTLDKDLTNFFDRYLNKLFKKDK